MNTELFQGMIDLVFKGNLLYLSPFLFLLMVILFAEQLIDLIKKAMDGNGRRSRG